MIWQSWFSSSLKMTPSGFYAVGNTTKIENVLHFSLCDLREHLKRFFWGLKLCTVPLLSRKSWCLCTQWCEPAATGWNFTFFLFC